ncbi:MAG: hypothetical protein GY749_26830 [Desulfobacteraceae bacterium]|nr:hypothetical protein [Desulfobacteraceae bacterium]
MNEVVVTGIGVVSPFGIGKEPFISGLKKNIRKEPVPVPEFRGTSLEGQQVGFIPDLKQASKSLPRKLVKFMSQAALIGCIAGKEAANEASVQDRFSPEQVGIFAATGLTAANIDTATGMLNACMDSHGNFSEKLFGEISLGLMNPLNSFQVLPNMPPCILSVLLGIKGPNLIFNPWEGQGGAAILEGLRAVQDGHADCVLAGAADMPSAPSTVVYLKQMNFIKQGEYPSPAGAYLVLESRDRAEQDRQKIYGVLKSVSVQSANENTSDPLAEQIGRTFAAAPAILLASVLMGIGISSKLVGTRGVSVEFRTYRTED